MRPALHAAIFSVIAFAMISCADGSGTQEDAVVDETGDCDGGRVECGSLCVDLLTDRNNCGGCGTVCQPFEVCQSGDCMIECPSEQIECAGQCVAIDSDLAHCGGCGKTCAAGTHAAEAICELGVCSVVCEAGWTDEDGDGSCETPCISTSTDETCNGLDDNCDGRVDEGFPCRMGREVGCTTTCGSMGTGICTLSCATPPPASCTPPEELCNGADDDCDGQQDEGFECVRRTQESGSVCELTGHLERTCSDSCAWGEWSCVGGGGDCVPGTTEGCGHCGTRTCTADAVWGLCGSEGVCAPDATGTQDCGDCGSQTRSCTDSCAWGAWGPCSGEGVCSAGETGTQDCGDCGTRSRTCTGSCAWSGWSGCGGQGVCSAGETGSEGCGNCGTRSHTCNDSCAWGAWSGCTGEGCAPGSTQPCGVCGMQACNTSCGWDACSGAGITEDCNDCGAWTCLPDGSDWGDCRRAHPEYCASGRCLFDGWCDGIPP